jgi:hypothetical protein
MRRKYFVIISQRVQRRAQLCNMEMELQSSSEKNVYELMFEMFLVQLSGG